MNGNQIVTSASTAKAIWLDTIYADTTHFGSFDSNRYYDRIFGTVVDDRTVGGSTSYGLPQWKSALSNTGLARGNDLNGWGASQNLFAPSLVSGGSVIPNGNLANNASGWTAWNQSAPAGTLVREPCTPGWCARYITGGSYGIVSSPRFSVVSGNWYRLTVDITTGAASQLVDMVVRRGGGGSNGYESLSDRPLRFIASRSWTRYSITFKATKTINANDPVTGDAGARVDFQNILPGQLLSMSNLEMTPMTPADSMNRSDLLLNTGSSSLLAGCPLAVTQPAMCANYLRLSDNQPVTWPYMLSARSSEIVYTRDLQLVDGDGDGIPDSQDACPGTATGFKVNSRGCALGQ